MKKRSTLALVTTSFPIAGDGSEAAGAFVADLVWSLAEHVDVRVVAPGPSTQTLRLSNEIDVFRFWAPSVPLSTLKPWHPGQLLQIQRVLRSGQRALDLAIGDGKVSHILALWALPSGHWARHAGKKTGTPYSVWTLGSDIWNLGKIPVIRNYLGRILREADHCYSDGFKLARDTETIGRRPVEFLPSSRKLETSRIEAVRSAPPYRLIFLGRWHYNKGIDLLLEALGLLNTEDWNGIERVRILGGGPMESVVRRDVLTLQQAGRPVELGSYVPKPIAEAEISNADFVLIPSRIESIPVIFSDAIKLETPVISMPTGDLPTLLQMGCGILSESIDSGGFCKAIRAALNTDASRFSTGLKETSKAFSLEDQIVPRLILDLLDKTNKYAP